MEQEIEKIETIKKPKKTKVKVGLTFGFIGATLAGAGIATGVCYGVYSKLYKRYTVTFERSDNGYFTAGNGLIYIDKVLPFRKIAKPEVGNYDTNKVFAGWYVDPVNDEYPFLDTENVTSNITLKPKFVDRDDTAYAIVTFNEGSISGATLTGNKEFAIRKANEKNYFGYVNEPYPDVLNYDFVHWSKNEAHPETPEDIMYNNTQITDNITLCPYYQYKIQEVIITGDEDTYVQSKYQYTSKILGSGSPVKWKVTDADGGETTVAEIDENTGILTAKAPGTIQVRAIPTIAPEKVAIKTVSIHNPYYKSDEIGCYGTINGTTAWWTISQDTLYSDAKIKVTRYGNINGSNDVVEIERNAFNLPIFVGDLVAGIKNNFLQNCTAFNSNVVFQENCVLSIIGNNFMNDCSVFNTKLKLPTNLMHIGSSFLQNCVAFNNGVTASNEENPLELPTNLTRINDNFLYNCESFNQQITIPVGVTSIGSEFLFKCLNFNSSLTLPEGLIEIGDHFLNECTTFNTQLDIPESVKTIREAFMYTCVAYSQNIAIPNNIEKIGTSFMYECQNFCSTTSTLTISTIRSPVDIFYKDTLNDTTLCVYATNCQAFQKCVKIAGTKASVLMDYFENRTDVSPYRKLISSE